MSDRAEPNTRGIASIAHLFLSQANTQPTNRRRPPQADEEPSVSFSESVDAQETDAGASEMKSDAVKEGPVKNDVVSAEQPVTSEAGPSADVDGDDAAVFNVAFEASGDDADELSDAEAALLADLPQEDEVEERAQHAIIFATPLKHSVVAAYQTIKRLAHEMSPEPKISIVIYDAETAVHGENALERLTQACLSFLEVLFESAVVYRRDEMATTLIKHYLAGREEQDNYVCLNADEIGAFARMGESADGGNDTTDGSVEDAGAWDTVETAEAGKGAAWPVHELYAVERLPGCLEELKDLLLGHWGLWREEYRDALLMPVGQLVGHAVETGQWAVLEPKGELSLLVVADEAMPEEDCQALMEMQLEMQEELPSMAQRFGHLGLRGDQQVGMLFVVPGHCDTAVLSEVWGESEGAVRFLRVHGVETNGQCGLLIV